MPVEICKKSYYLPKNLMDSFADWCKPGRDYSPKIAGAIFYYMQLPANIREICEKAAYSQDINEELKKLAARAERHPDEVFSELEAILRHVQSLVQDSQETQAAKRRTKHR